MLTDTATERRDRCCVLSALQATRCPPGPRLSCRYDTVFPRHTLAPSRFPTA